MDDLAGYFPSDIFSRRRRRFVTSTFSVKLGICFSAERGGAQVFSVFFLKKNKFGCVKRAGKVKSVFGGGIGLKTHLGLDVWVI